MRDDQHRPQSGAGERRAHRRLALRIPVECRRGDRIVRTLTQNISTGGAYLETEQGDFQPGDRLDLALTLPAADGVSPYPGDATCTAEVLRVRPTPQPPAEASPRDGVALRFLDRLRITYAMDQ